MVKPIVSAELGCLGASKQNCRFSYEELYVDGDPPSSPEPLKIVRFQRNIGWWVFRPKGIISFISRSKTFQKPSNFGPPQGIIFNKWPMRHFTENQTKKHFLTSHFCIILSLNILGSNYCRKIK